MNKIEYTKIKGQSIAYYGLLAGLGFIILLGLLAVWYMEHNGHHVTGMTNQIIWGTPHVFPFS
jgi:molybdopterin-containing oxidoreductase family membrane subunit